MARIFGILTIIIVAVFGLSFAVLNARPVTLHYYFGSRELPLAMTMVLALAVGAAVGVCCSIPMLLRQKREMRRLRRQVQAVEQEINNLRAIPLQDSQ